MLSRGSFLYMLALAVCLLAGCSSAGTPLADPGRGQPDIGGLSEVLGDELTRLYSDAVRTASAAPAGPTNRVTDLEVTITRQEETCSVELSWTEKLTGDYNLDGLVNAQDLTPIAQHWEEVASREGVADDFAAWQLCRIDGNADGLITISDITPIAQNWLARLDGYRVYRTADGTDQPQLLCSGEQPEFAVSCQRIVEEDAVIRYHFVDDDVPLGSYAYHVAPVDSDSGSEGCASECRRAELEPPAEWHLSTVWHDSSVSPDLELINSVPSLVFVDQHDATIMATAALDETGTDWREPWVLIEVQANLPTLTAAPAGAALAWYQKKETEDGDAADLMFATIADLLDPEYDAILIDPDVSDYFTTHCMHCQADISYLDGLPAITYCRMQYAGPTGSIYAPQIIQAADAAGTTWHAPVELHPGAFVDDVYMYVTIGAGGPVVSWSWYIGGSGDCNGCFVCPPYVDAESGGWAWAEPVQVGTTALIWGQPHVTASGLYITSPGNEWVGLDEDMYVFKADDDGGSSWSTSWPLDLPPDYELLTEDAVVWDGAKWTAILLKALDPAAPPSETEWWLYSTETDDIEQGIWSTPLLIDGPICFMYGRLSADVLAVDGALILAYDITTLDLDGELRIASLN